MKIKSKSSKLNFSYNRHDYYVTDIEKIQSPRNEERGYKSRFQGESE